MSGPSYPPAGYRVLRKSSVSDTNIRPGWQHTCPSRQTSRRPPSSSSGSTNRRCLACHRGSTCNVPQPSPKVALVSLRDLPRRAAGTQTYLLASSMIFWSKWISSLLYLHRVPTRNGWRSAAAGDHELVAVTEQVHRSVTCFNEPRPRPRISID